MSDLAVALEERGWTTLPLFNGTTPVLRVFDARVPSIGESVVLVAAPNAASIERVPWFKSSTGVLFAPCTAPVRASEAIHFLLAPWIAMALQGDRDSHGGH
ncbi:hypothetical protein ACQEU3_44315 [Spirillospora sp. CA-253888]